MSRDSDSGRVVITGLGAASCLGIGSHIQFQNASLCNSGITGFSNSLSIQVDLSCAGLVPSNIVDHFDSSTLGMYDRVAHLSWVASKEALEHSGLKDLRSEELERSAVFWGTGFGGANTVENAYDNIYINGEDRVRPFTVIGVMSNGAAALISLNTAFKGPSITYSTACASSAHAIGEAYRSIKHGYCDRAIAGGAESLLTAASIKAWEALKTLAMPDPENIAKSCKPFSKNRTGFVLGEGAAAIVLESLSSAKKRGAIILAEIIGYGATSDSLHITKPDPLGQSKAMQLAINDAGLNADQVVYINAHGTATQVGDIAETISIKNTFGLDAAKKLAISSTKAIHGHTLGAAGALELLITVQAMQNNIAPGTAFLEFNDPQCDLNYLPLRSIELSIPYAMSNSFAFGGSNVSLILARDVS
ncbi:beta-ketoacyl synthase [Polynucleobacter sp. AP-Latsch-80-C2]|jgi:3-oxoacyl-[acyl-carrier-protein] synthase II|uniref:beta-ketoacyl-[acyl-carrier-protein] synthase family protein n=1 Tax=Polynucleobacter sp. AP-Latsch-80-C2 TaxID=2576931 RepID=UPI001C0D520D|nr:beta-ketoacyl-[acyl-carrier-protein] synthase family protein [Polynucleobacter sp. AP-Latsch-80-C2]MBU3624125.1 beta-ketoacyl-[acyl-carrier-protein] synthase family protein [Polynucleobacter sp. AP-Latsch-80-C2]